MLLRTLCFVVCMLVGNLGFSKEERWTHYGVRPLAMGNAYVAVADDFNALFYNPAGLARLKEWDGEFLNPYLSFSSGSMDLIEKASSLSGTGSEATKNTLALLEDNVGKNHHIGLGLTPHLIFKGFGFGLGMDMVANITFHRYPSVDLDVGPRFQLPIAFAWNMLEDRLSLGVALKAMMRAGISREFSIQDVEAFTNKDDNATGPKLDDYVEGGTGYGVDMGLLFTPIQTMEPTLGLSIADFGGTPYTKMNVGGEAVGSPETRLPSLNAGVSIKPLQLPSSYVLTSIDVHSINQPFSFSKKLNMGVEYGLGSIVKLQAGLHQGYLTCGAQLDVRLLNLRYATYAEELGVSSGEGANPSRRHILQIKLLI